MRARRRGEHSLDCGRLPVSEHVVRDDAFNGDAEEGVERDRAFWLIYLALGGAVVKDGAHLEALSTGDTIVFVKTGTLTTGTPAVTEIHTAPGVTDGDLLIPAAAAEAYSEHPLGQAIVTHVREWGLPVGPAEAFAYQPSLGVTATVTGKTITVGSRGFVADPRQARGQVTATAVHVGIGLAASGLLSPVAAALIQVGSETAFILNSARLIPSHTSRATRR